MTVTRFCEVEGVSAPSFYQWRKKLDSSVASPSVRAVFEQVVVAPATASPGLRVRLVSGAEIEVAGGNLEVIRAVVGELARAEWEFAAGEDPAC
jgi:hypothetical protein